MTITAATPTYIQSPGNGSATTFAFPFKVFAATDVIVGFITAAGYTRQFSGYAVANVDVNGGGNVVFTTAPPLNTTVDIRSITPAVQLTEFANLGAFLPENHTEALDRVTRVVQDTYRLSYLFGIHGPDQEGTLWPALPSASVRAGSALVFDSNGLPTVGVTVSQSITQGLIGLMLYPQTAAEISVGVVPTNYAYPADPEYNVKRYGASLASSSAQNLGALNTAIIVAKASSGASAKAGAYIIIPPDCHYGYKFTDITTYPQINSGSVPITVIDYSQGDTYDNYPTIYDGAQCRWFFYTPQTTTPGSHNGNGMVHGGTWHPYYQINNNAGLANPSVGATDNRRASYEFGMDGLPMWRLGQGTLQGAGYAPFQLLNFTLQMEGNASQIVTLTGNPTAGATAATLTAPWGGATDIAGGQFTNPNGDIRDIHLTNGSTAITWSQALSGNTTGPSLTLAPVNPTTGGSIVVAQYSTGNLYFNTGSNLSDGNYHFKAPVTGFYNGIFESLSGSCEVRFRNANGVTQDVSIKNTNSGVLSLANGTLGDLVKYLVNGQGQQLYGFAEAQHATAYGSVVTPDCSLGNYFTVNATTGAAFAIAVPLNPAAGMRITIEIINTSGGALGALTWNGVFKMNAFPATANGNSTAIDFRYNGTNWRQVGTPVAVAN